MRVFSFSFALTCLAVFFVGFWLGSSDLRVARNFSNWVSDTEYVVLASVNVLQACELNGQDCRSSRHVSASSLELQRKAILARAEVVRAKRQLKRKIDFLYWKLQR